MNSSGVAGETLGNYRLGTHTITQQKVLEKALSAKYALAFTY